ELPTPIDDTSLGRSAVLNVTSVLSPTTTNEVIFTWSQLKNDNVWQDPSKVQLGTYGLGSFTNPFASTPFIPNLGLRGATARGGLWSNNDVDDLFSYNGFIRLGDSFTKVL